MKDWVLYFNIFELYLHRVTSHYETHEIKEFDDIYTSEKDIPADILIDGLLASKGLGRLPTTYEELKLYTNQISEKE